MSISPWMQYDTQPSWEFPLLLDSRPLEITGLTLSNFQLILHDVISGQELAMTGYFSDLSAGSGTVDDPPSIIYHQTRADVTVTGQKRAYIVITFSNGDQETLSLGYIEIKSR